MSQQPQHSYEQSSSQQQQQQQYNTLLQNLTRQTQQYQGAMYQQQQYNSYPGNIIQPPHHQQQSPAGQSASDVSLQSHYLQGLLQQAASSQENVQNQSHGYSMQFNGMASHQQPSAQTGLMLPHQQQQQQQQSHPPLNPGNLFGQQQSQSLGNYMQQLQVQQQPQQQIAQQSADLMSMGGGGPSGFQNHQYALNLLNQQQQQQLQQQQLHLQQFQNQQSYQNNYSANSSGQLTIQQLQQSLQALQNGQQNVQGNLQSALQFLTKQALESSNTQASGQTLQQILQSAQGSQQLFQSQMSTNSSSFFPQNQPQMVSMQTAHQINSQQEPSIGVNQVQQQFDQNSANSKNPDTQNGSKNIASDDAIKSQQLNQAAQSQLSSSQTNQKVGQVSINEQESPMDQFERQPIVSDNNTAQTSKKQSGHKTKIADTQFQTLSLSNQKSPNQISQWQYFQKHEKLQHKCMMLDYKVNLCTNQHHLSQVASGNLSIDEQAAFLQKQQDFQCMEHHAQDMNQEINPQFKTNEWKIQTIEKSLNRRPLFDNPELNTDGTQPENLDLVYDQNICKKIGKSCNGVGGSTTSKKGKSCTNCSHCHSDIERLYHPAIYKTQPCRDMNHIQIKIYQNNGMQMANSKFTQADLHSFAVCPYYHDEVIDQRSQNLVQFYINSEQGDHSPNQTSSASSKNDEIKKQFEELSSLERYKFILDFLNIINSSQSISDVELLEDSIRQKIIESLFILLRSLRYHNNDPRNQKFQFLLSQLFQNSMKNSKIVQSNSFIENLNDNERVGSQERNSKDNLEELDNQKTYPLSEKGADEVSHDTQNDEVNKQLLKFMKNLEVDVTNQSIGKAPSEHPNENNNASLKVQVEQQNSLLKMQLMQQKQLAKASKVQLLKSFNKQYPQGKNIKPCNFMNIETEVTKIANRINSQLIHNSQAKLSPSENDDKNSIISKGNDCQQLQQISIINLNKNHISVKKADENNKSNTSQEKRDQEKKSKSQDKIGSNSIEPVREASNSIDCNLSDSIVHNKSFSESDDLSNSKPKKLSPVSQQSGNKQNQKKRTSQKREKIFIGIYSSYLSLNKSYSRDRGTKGEENQKINQQKQTQNLRMVENQQVDEESLSGDELETSKDQISQKQGQSSIIKYIDLSKFKIEKCKNQAQGRQHNIKHCRYFHTLKDRRRLLDFDFINMGIDDVIQLAKQSGQSQEAYLDHNQISLKQNPDEYFKYCMKSLNCLLEQIYLPDLCNHQNTDKCPSKDDCQMSHNRVESVYHPEKYKSKYCTKYPKNLSKCEYGDYCSFAHSTKELKTRLIHKMTKDADFYMFYFKTEWCPFNKEHNKAQCVYAHNWQDFRRKPNIFKYKAHTICENWKPGTFIAKYHEGCPEQASCVNSHGWKEQEYHPMFYKTMKCEEFRNTSGSSKHCQRGIECPYYHSEEDRREPFEANQKRDRKDFYYDKILEMSMNLSNINQLQELILIKISEQYCHDQQQRQYYLENRITRQHTQGLINSNCFRNITLFCMLSKKVLPFEQFTNHMIVKSIQMEKKQITQVSKPVTNSKRKTSSQSLKYSNIDNIDNSSKKSGSTTSDVQATRPNQAQHKIPNRGSNPNFEKQNQIHLPLYNSQSSNNSDLLPNQQMGYQKYKNNSPALERMQSASHSSSNNYIQPEAYAAERKKPDISSTNSAQKLLRANSRSSFHSKHSINSETPSNYGRLDQPFFANQQPQNINQFSQNYLQTQQQQPQLYSNSHSPPNNLLSFNQASQFQSHQHNQQFAINQAMQNQNNHQSQSPPFQQQYTQLQANMYPTNMLTNQQNWPAENQQRKFISNNNNNNNNNYSPEIKQQLAEHDEMPTDKHSFSNKRNQEDQSNQNILRSNTKPSQQVNHGVYHQNNAQKNSEKLDLDQNQLHPASGKYHDQAAQLGVNNQTGHSSAISPTMRVDMINQGENAVKIQKYLDNTSQNYQLSPSQPLEPSQNIMQTPDKNESIQNVKNNPQQNTGSIFRQYFNNKFQGDEQQNEDEDDRMSIQPQNQSNQIKMQDDQFRFKKFNSQRFDPKLINIKTLEYQLNSLVEEITQDADANQDHSAKYQLGAMSQHDGQLSIFSGYAQNQIFDSKADKQQNLATSSKQIQPIEENVLQPNSFNNLERKAVDNTHQNNQFNQQQQIDTQNPKNNAISQLATVKHTMANKFDASEQPQVTNQHISHVNNYDAEKQAFGAEKKEANQVIGNIPSAYAAANNEDDPFFYDENSVDSKSNINSVNK